MTDFSPENTFQNASDAVAEREIVKNRYDHTDMVRRHNMIRAGSLKIACYTVRDPETLEWSKLQFHMTYDNHVMGVMSEGAAKLFADFVQQQLAVKP